MVCTLATIANVAMSVGQVVSYHEDAHAQYLEIAVLNAPKPESLKGPAVFTFVDGDGALVKPEPVVEGVEVEQGNMVILHLAAPLPRVPVLQLRTTATYLTSQLSIWGTINTEGTSTIEIELMAMPVDGPARAGWCDSATFRLSLADKAQSVPKWVLKEHELVSRPLPASDEATTPCLFQVKPALPPGVQLDGTMTRDGQLVGKGKLKTHPRATKELYNYHVSIATARDAHNDDEAYLATASVAPLRWVSDSSAVTPLAEIDFSKGYPARADKWSAGVRWSRWWAPGIGGAPSTSAPRRIDGLHITARYRVDEDQGQRDAEVEALWVSQPDALWKPWKRRIASGEKPRVGYLVAPRLIATAGRSVSSPNPTVDGSSIMRLGGGVTVKLDRGPLEWTVEADVRHLFTEELRLGKDAAALRVGSGIRWFARTTLGWSFGITKIELKHELGEEPPGFKYVDTTTLGMVFAF